MQPTKATRSRIQKKQVDQVQPYRLKHGRQTLSRNPELHSGVNALSEIGGETAISGCRTRCLGCRPGSAISIRQLWRFVSRDLDWM